MSVRAQSPEFLALRLRERMIQARFTDPYGRDNYDYDKAKKADPEWVRLFDSFIESRRKEKEAAKDLSFKETEAQETRAELEAIASTEVANPITGELIDVSDPTACAAAIAELRLLEDRIKEVRRVLGETLIAESKRLGSKTLHLPGADVTLTEKKTIVWDVEKLEELRDAGLAEERWNELVREVVEQKVDANVAKSIAGVDDAYRKIIEAARTDHVGERHVSDVKRSKR